MAFLVEGWFVPGEIGPCQEASRKADDAVADLKLLNPNGLQNPPFDD
jgi:hypothetical protein